MKNIINSTLNGLIPSITENLSSASNELVNGASNLITPGAGIINQNGQISDNPQAFGFAFEHLQAIGFNVQASLGNSNFRAYQIPADGTKYGADIHVVDQVGKVVAEIQAKVGTSTYVKDQVNSGHYQTSIVTNVENQDISGTTINIEVEGIKSFPVNKEFAQWTAENPYMAANLIYAAATLGEIGGAGIQGAAINSTINILLQSIKIVGAYCRGEQELTQKELEQFLAVAIDGLKSGFIRGAAIKIIQKLAQGNAFAALGFTVGVEVIPALIKVLNNEITVEQAIHKVGARAFTSGVVTTLVILFPPIGTALLSLSIIQSIWLEISPEWKEYIKKNAGITAMAGGAMVAVGASAGTVVTVASTLGVAASTGTAISGLSGAAATNAALAWLGGGTIAAGGGGVAAGSAIVAAVSTGGAVVAIAGVGVIGKKVWDNLSKEQRQAITDKIDNSAPEQVKVAYGVTTEKATEILGITSDWIGKSSLETAKHIQKVAQSKEVRNALNKTAEMSSTAGTIALGGAILAGEATWKQVGIMSDKVGSWWKNC